MRDEWEMAKLAQELDNWKGGSLQDYVLKAETLRWGSRARALEELRKKEVIDASQSSQSSQS